MIRPGSVTLRSTRLSGQSHHCDESATGCLVTDMLSSEILLTVNILMLLLSSITFRYIRDLISLN